jgi:glycosyltransferase involved in cell wall biosynthesis
MKILLAAGLYPPDIGGPARYAQMLVRGLPAEGIVVSLVPFSLVRRRSKLFRHLIYTWYLWRSSADVQAIYALDAISVGVPARAVAFLRGVPLLVRLGGDYAWEQGVQRFGLEDTLDEYTAHPKRAPLRVRVLAGIQQKVVGVASQVVVPSLYLKSIVSQWGIDSNKINVIYSAHSVPETKYDRGSLRAKYQMNGLVLLSIARLTPWKGMRNLIELVGVRHRRGEVVSLYIGGDGPDRAMLEAYAKECGVAEAVHFLGALSFSEVFAVVTASDIFLLDTAYEGLSHQLIEVMALGTPIITTPVGGNSELLTNEVNALLVPVGDTLAYDTAVTRLVTDSCLRDSLTTAARARATEFAKDDAIPKIAELLKSVVS